MEQRPGPRQDSRTPEGTRSGEMSRFELTSLAQEAAANDMKLGSGERSKLRQALDAFRDATLFRIEHPPERKDAAAPAGKALSFVEDPTTPGHVYVMRQREILGDGRYDEFSRREQRERTRLIVDRQVFRKVGDQPAPMLSPAPPAGQ